MHLAAQHPGGLDDGVELNAVVFRVEDAVELAAAGLHRPGHPVLADMLFGHGLRQLPGEHPLHRDGGGFRMDYRVKPDNDGRGGGVDRDCASDGIGGGPAAP